MIPKGDLVKTFICIVMAVLATTFMSSEANAVARGRVVVANNTVKTDQGTLLRAGTFWIESDQPQFIAYYRSDEPWIRAKENHLNAVRLAIGYGWVQNDTFPLDKYLSYLDEFIGRAAAENMYVIIDWHYMVNSHGDGPKMDVAKGQTFWSAVAPRYANRTNVLYELCNEPVAWTVPDYNAQDIQNQQTLYNLMRQNAPDTHIIVLSFAVPNSGMANLANQLSVDWSKTSVGFHGYYKDTSQYIQQLKALRPCINTEFMPPTAFTDQPGIKPGGDFGMRPMEGDIWNQQTMERLEISWAGWFFLWQPEPLAFEDDAARDARSKGYYWQADASMNIVDVTDAAPASSTGFVLNSTYNTYNGTFTVTNNSGAYVDGPLNVVLTDLPPGVTLVNATGTLDGKPAVQVPGVYSLAPGASVTVNVAIADPAHAGTPGTANTYSGVISQDSCVRSAP